MLNETLTFFSIISDFIVMFLNLTWILLDSIGFYSGEPTTTFSGESTPFRPMPCNQIPAARRFIVLLSERNVKLRELSVARDFFFDFLRLLLRLPMLGFRVN